MSYRSVTFSVEGVFWNDKNSLVPGLKAEMHSCFQKVILDICGFHAQCWQHMSIPMSFPDDTLTGSSLLKVPFIKYVRIFTCYMLSVLMPPLLHVMRNGNV